MLSDLLKSPATSVIGIDASTNSIAFCLFKNGLPHKWGKINLVGGTIFEKIYDAKKKMHALSKELNAEHIVVEGAVLVRSADAVIKLSYVYGVVIAELMGTGANVMTISPTSWQSFIGNNNPTKLEKKEIRETYPGYTESWYKNQLRNMRKQRTVDWIKQKFNIEINDFDVADSFGIAYYAQETMTKR